ncbi:MAG: hypothetical protein ACLPSF_12740 [Methylocella sp.]
MSKANANRIDAHELRANDLRAPSPIENWLRRAMADLAGQGPDDETPIDLTQSLAAMAALLQDAVRPREAPVAAHERDGKAGGVDASPLAPTAAEQPPPPGVGGAGETARGESPADPPRELNQVEAPLRAGGEESLRRVLTDLEAGLDLRAARPGNAEASSSAPDPGAGPARLTARGVGEDAARGRDSTPYDALTSLIESTRRQLVETFETGLAGAALETRGLKDMVQTLAKKTEVPSAALERSIARLLEQLEQARLTAPDAAEAACRLGSDAHERRIAREVAELRAARVAADNRIHLVLNAVQETVGKVADRLAGIESDPGAMRPMTPPSPERRPPESRPWTGPEKGAVARGARQAAPSGAPAPGASATQKRPPPADHDAGVIRGAEIDDFLIEPGAGFPPRAPKPRPPADPLATRDASKQGWAENARGHTDAGAPARMHAGRQRCEATPADRAGGVGFFDAHRKPIILVGAALSVALGVYALTRYAALKGFEPQGFLKSIGLDAAPLERRSVVANGRYTITDIRRESAIDAGSNVGGPTDLLRAAFGLLDPAAIESARKNQSLDPNAPAMRAIAGGAAILPDKIAVSKITVRARLAKAPRL